VRRQTALCSTSRVIFIGIDAIGTAGKTGRAYGTDKVFGLCPTPKGA
jgi:hypothetical protein